MTDTAAAQLTRIVSLVAESSWRERNGDEPLTLDAIAGSFGVRANDIARDIRTLTLLGDHADAEWLLSLNVWQQDDRVAVSSGGPFRRPLRLSPDELLSIQVALAMDPDGEALARKLAGFFAAPAAGVATANPGRQPGVQATHGGATEMTVADALRDGRCLELRYAAEGSRKAETWMVCAHQLVSWRDRSYLIAWVERENGWRTFRMDRVLDAKVTGAVFEHRSDFVPVTNPSALFQAPDSAVDLVRVRYAPGLAPLIRERHADCQEMEDGSVAVTLRASSKEWLVRRVLEHGEDAEVVEPESYRLAMKTAVA